MAPARLTRREANRYIKMDRLRGRKKLAVGQTRELPPNSIGHPA